MFWQPPLKDSIKGLKNKDKSFHLGCFGYWLSVCSQDKFPHHKECIQSPQKDPCLASFSIYFQSFFFLLSLRQLHNILLLMVIPQFSKDLNTMHYFLSFLLHFCHYTPLILIPHFHFLPTYTFLPSYTKYRVGITLRACVGKCKAQGKIVYKIANNISLALSGTILCQKYWYIGDVYNSIMILFSVQNIS